MGNSPYNRGGGGIMKIALALAFAVVFSIVTAATAGDPFDDARYAIRIKATPPRSG